MRIRKKTNVFKFKDTHKRLKAKCKCGEIFRVELEFRRYYRKEVRLAGEYFFHEKDERGDILIEDISMTGIKFSTLKRHYISRNDTVELKFTLNNQRKTEIQTFVKIIWIADRNVGAQFINLKHFKQDLVFYLTN